MSESVTEVERNELRCTAAAFLPSRGQSLLWSVLAALCDAERTRDANSKGWLEDQKALRALRLTDDDRAALAWARQLVGFGDDFMARQRHDPDVAEHLQKCEAACAVLDRLTKAGTP